MIIKNIFTVILTVSFLVVSNYSVTYAYDSYYDSFELGSDRFIFEPTINPVDKSFRVGFKFRFGDEYKKYEPSFNSNDYIGSYDPENSFHIEPVFVLFYGVLGATAGAMIGYGTSALLYIANDDGEEDFTHFNGYVIGGAIIGGLVVGLGGIIELSSNGTSEYYDEYNEPTDEIEKEDRDFDWEAYDEANKVSISETVSNSLRAVNDALDTYNTNTSNSSVSGGSDSQRKPSPHSSGFGILFDSEGLIDRLGAPGSESILCVSPPGKRYVPIEGSSLSSIPHEGKEWESTGKNCVPCDRMMRSGKKDFYYKENEYDCE